MTNSNKTVDNSLFSKSTILSWEINVACTGPDLWKSYEDCEDPIKLWSSNGKLSVGAFISGSFVWNVFSLSRVFSAY